MSPGRGLSEPHVARSGRRATSPPRAFYKMLTSNFVRMLHVFEFRDGLISRENVWLDGGTIMAQLTA